MALVWASMQQLARNNLTKQVGLRQSDQFTTRIMACYGLFPFNYTCIGMYARAIIQFTDLDKAC